MPEQTYSIVALVGRPNVGKSTLFNRITRSRKALVDSTPGVTRDRHYERVVWNDKLFMLVDTGGIDENAEDVMVGHIREQAMTAIEEADIILFLMDGREGLTPADHEVIQLLRKTQKTIFHVVNKGNNAPALAAMVTFMLCVTLMEIAHNRMAPVLFLVVASMVSFLMCMATRETGNRPLK